MNPADKDPETDDATAHWQPSPQDLFPTTNLNEIAAKPPTIGENSNASHETQAPLSGDTSPPQIAPNYIPTSGGQADGITLPVVPGYEVLARIAQGGMGIVYRARDLTLQRHVAIKVPRPGFINSQEDKQRFLLEAKSAARLRHPNICPIYEVREIAGQPYIVMAFIEGQTLKDWGRQQEVGPRFIAEFMATLASAVQYAHAQGVLHRDLKPANVMVDSQNNQPLLMDFGLAKELGQESGLTISGEVMGTPAYMAPEQAAGKTDVIGPASDVYALGVILYELLSGSPPFRGSIVEILVKVQTEEPPSLRTLNRQLHPDLEIICQKAMAKAPADRYSSAGDFAADLRRFAQGELIVARRQPWHRRLARVVAKNRMVAVLGGLLLVVLLAMMFATPWLSSQLRSSQISAELQAKLEKAEWSQLDFADAQRLLERLQAESPAKAETSRRSLIRHVNDWIDRRASRGRLEESDLTEIEGQIHLLQKLDAKLADKQLAALDARRGLWKRIATLEVPFANADALLPGIRKRDDGLALLGAPTLADSIANASALFLTPESSSGNFELKGTILLPPESSASFVVAATEQHRSIVTALAASPNGEYFVSADAIGNLRLYVSASGKKVADLPRHRAAVGGVAFSADGKWLSSAAMDGEVHLIDMATRKVAQTFAIEVPPPHFDYSSAFFAPPVAFSADSHQLMAGSGNGKTNGEIRRWRLPDGTALPPLKTALPTGWVMQLTASADPPRLAAATWDNRLQLWDLSTEKPIFDTPLLAPDQTTRLTALAIHPAGNVLASTVAGVIHLVNEKGNLFAKLEAYQSGSYALAFDPKGKILAAGYESGTVVLWDHELRQIVKTLPDNRRRCESLIFDPHNNWLIGGVEQGTIHRWDLATGEERYAIDGSGYRFSVERSREGRVSLRISRSELALREQVIDLSPGPFEFTARREGDRLELQINRLPQFIFLDYFPPKPLSIGRWGVGLQSGAELQKLIVRQSNEVKSANALEQANAKLAAGEFEAAIEMFDQQAVGAGEDRASQRSTNEAQLKSAIGLLRLNRRSEAVDRLRAMSGSDASDPAVAMARFMLWDALIALNDRTGADQLFASLRIDQTGNQIAEVIPIEMRKRILTAYSDPVMRRTGQLQPGMISKLQTSIEMADFLKLPAYSFTNWRVNHLAALRLNGQHAEAELVSQQLIELLETEGLKGDIRQRTPGEQVSFMRMYGSIARARKEPQRPESLLKVLLFNPQTNELLPDIAGERLALLLELAQVEASRENWQLTVDHLAPLLGEDAKASLSRDAMGEAALLRGLAYDKLGQQEAAVAAWKNHPFPFLDDVEKVYSLNTSEVMQYWMLRSLAGDLGDPEAQVLAAGMRMRLAASGGNVNKVFELVPISSTVLNNAWRTRYGREAAEAIACGNCLPMEISAHVIQVGAHSLLCNGAFGDSPSAEQEEVVKQLIQDGFRAYGNDELSFISISQVGLGWKGVPPVFGTWKTLFGQLPVATRSRGAYVLGCRFARRGKPAEARALWQLAQELAPDDMKLNELITAELKMLPL
ncbi:WD40 repeat domain-containing serine/threonine protein kinase [Anatilimnocola sp. NA78]|uniref:WD40 repeat domain-containing serine/threonine protein kinase n=1 Tax=Anatilimnocola sp. NA78 TaxID=3415683 RepID=UPI003CE5580E